MATDEKTSTHRKGKTKISGVEHLLESWVKYDFDRDLYILRVQTCAIGSDHAVKSSSFRISKEFIEDNLGDNLGIEHLGLLNHKMLQTHASEMLSPDSDTSGIQVREWLVNCSNVSS